MSLNKHQMRFEIFSSLILHREHLVLMEAPWMLESASPELRRWPGQVRLGRLTEQQEPSEPGLSLLTKTGQGPALQTPSENRDKSTLWHITDVQ